MMDWTDRHCRYFMRLLCPRVMLYTEMITAAALHHGDTERLLRFDPSEHPVALQLGGSDPRLMAAAAKLGASRGYDEININVGCPSDRVQSGAFGACLMAEPESVAACVASMREVTDVPVTVKSRIGIDDRDDYGFLADFVGTVAQAGCTKFIVHARKAILRGISPKENRSIPPLDYERVYRLKRDFPRLGIVLNGGITTTRECRQHLRQVDGIMIGRQAYHQPWLLTDLELMAGGCAADLPGDQVAVARQMLPYIEQELAAGTSLKHITRHMLGLFAGVPGARAWRRYLSEHAQFPGAGAEVVEGALAALPRAA